MGTTTMTRRINIKPTMRIKYLHKYDLTRPCVAKLHFGEKYLILKTEDIAASVKKLIEQFEETPIPGESVKQYAVRRTRSAILETAAGKEPCRVEILLSSTKGEELLAREQVLLNQKDKACLNINRTPARPAWINQYMTAPAAIPGVFRIKGKHRQAPAVVKIRVGDKYFIWKCKDIQEFPAKFSESMERNLLIEDGKLGPLLALVQYMRRHRIRQGSIEVMYKTEYTHRGIEKLLAFEQALIDTDRRKPNCLNRNKKQYRPKWLNEYIIDEK